MFTTCTRIGHAPTSPKRSLRSPRGASERRAMTISLSKIARGARGARSAGGFADADPFSALSCRATNNVHFICVHYKMVQCMRANKAARSTINYSRAGHRVLSTSIGAKRKKANTNNNNNSARRWLRSPSPLMSSTTSIVPLSVFALSLRALVPPCALSAPRFSARRAPLNARSLVAERRFHGAYDAQIRYKNKCIIPY